MTFKDNWLQIPCRYVSIRLTDNEILFSIRNWNTHQFRIYISKRYFQIKTNTLGSSLAHIKYIDCNGGGALSLWSNILQPQPSYLDSHESSPSSRIFFTFFPCTSPYEGDFTRENKSWDGKFHTESGALKHALNGQAVRENSHWNVMTYVRT